ncbi:hypothetical protein M8791_RS22635 [Escherichia coli]|nr:hypothetical protein [Escherichia coli]
MTDYAISKKSKRSLWIPILVFITLAACASAGYSYWHSHQVAAVLATEEGKKNLIAEIKTTLSTPLVAGQPKQDVTDVLYTAFILR